MCKMCIEAYIKEVKYGEKQRKANGVSKRYRNRNNAAPKKTKKRKHQEASLQSVGETNGQRYVPLWGAGGKQSNPGKG